MGKRKSKRQTVYTMHFKFTAVINSPTEMSVFQFKAKQIGEPTRFSGDSVTTEYVGDVRDNAFQMLLELYEQVPNHVITLSSK